MSSFTTYRGRRCTKVKRNDTAAATSPLGSVTSIADHTLLIPAKADSTFTGTSATLSQSEIVSPEIFTKRPPEKGSFRQSAATSTVPPPTQQLQTLSTAASSSAVQGVNNPLPGSTTSAAAQNAPPPVPGTVVPPTSAAPGPPGSSQAPVVVPVAGTNNPLSTSSQGQAGAQAASAEPDVAGPGVTPVTSGGSPSPPQSVHQGPTGSLSSLLTVADPTYSVGPHGGQTGVPTPVAGISGASGQSSSARLQPTGGSNDPGHDANDDTSKSATHTRTEAAAGTVGGVVALVLISVLIFFCIKRRRGRESRRRSVESPLMDFRDSMGSRPSNEMTEPSKGLGAMMASRKIISRPEGSSGQPEMSNWPSGPFRRSYSGRRHASLDVRAPSLKGRLQGMLGKRNPGMQETMAEAIPRVPSRPPVLPLPVPERRSSVSSIIRGFYSADFDDQNDPFRDPEPFAPLRLTNPDASRHGSPISTPRIAPDTPNFSVTGGMAPMVPEQPKRAHRPAVSLSQNPFLDPTELEHAPRDARHSSNVLPETMIGADAMRMAASHSRSRSSISIRSARETLLARETSLRSLDSGFASASSASQQMMFQRNQTGNSERVLSQLSDTSNASTAVSNSTIRLSALLPPLSMHDSVQSTFNFDFGFGHGGEPGPTRPTTEAFTPSTNRLSDPFDLDVPELLGSGAAAVSPDKDGLARSGSDRSVAGRQQKQLRGGALQGWAEGGRIART